MSRTQKAGTQGHNRQARTHTHSRTHGHTHARTHARTHTHTHTHKYILYVANADIVSFRRNSISIAFVWFCMMCDLQFVIIIIICEFGKYF